MTDCLVSVNDFRLHWQGITPKAGELYVSEWLGTDRRVGVKDRRVAVRDRREDTQRGRRYRLADRRKASV